MRFLLLCALRPRYTAAEAVTTGGGNIPLTEADSARFDLTSYTFPNVVTQGATEESPLITVSLNGYLGSSKSWTVDPSNIGFDGAQLEKCLEDMQNNMSMISCGFKVPFTPKCDGTAKAELRFVPGITSKETAVMTLSANGAGTGLYCPDSARIQSVTVLPSGDIDFGSSPEPKEITVRSDTLNTEGWSGSSSGTFSYSWASWPKEHPGYFSFNVTFNPSDCVGPASERIRIPTNDVPVEIFVRGTGTGEAGAGSACEDRFPR